MHVLRAFGQGVKKSSTPNPLLSKHEDKRLKVHEDTHEIALRDGGLRFDEAKVYYNLNENLSFELSEQQLLRDTIYALQASHRNTFAFK